MLLFFFSSFRSRTFSRCLNALALSLSVSQFVCLFHRAVVCVCAQFPSLVILTTYCQSLGMPRSFSHFFWHNDFFFSFILVACRCSHVRSFFIFCIDQRAEKKRKRRVRENGISQRKKGRSRRKKKSHQKEQWKKIVLPN